MFRSSRSDLGVDRQVQAKQVGESISIPSVPVSFQIP